MIARVPFGSTGHESTRTIFGAAALGSVTQAEADSTLELVLEQGVNHIDTAASYGDPSSGSRNIATTSKTPARATLTGPMKRPRFRARTGSVIRHAAHGRPTWVLA